jgi:hypothetical protein
MSRLEDVLALFEDYLPFHIVKYILLDYLERAIQLNPKLDSTFSSPENVSIWNSFVRSFRDYMKRGAKFVFTSTTGEWRLVLSKSRSFLAL